MAQNNPSSCAQQTETIDCPRRSSACVQATPSGDVITRLPLPSVATARRGRARPPSQTPQPAVVRGARANGPAHSIGAGHHAIAGATVRDCAEEPDLWRPADGKPLIVRRADPRGPAYSVRRGHDPIAAAVGRDGAEQSELRRPADASPTVVRGADRRVQLTPSAPGHHPIAASIRRDRAEEPELRRPAHRKPLIVGRARADRPACSIRRGHDSIAGPVRRDRAKSPSSGDQQTLRQLLSAALDRMVQLTPSALVITRLPLPFVPIAQKSPSSGDQQT